MGPTPGQGQLWGARADDWAAAQERVNRPAYDAILDVLEPWAGATLLDLGCGAGRFASLASARGARVAGLDAAAELIEIAERRVPSGAFRVGEMAELPYADGSFTVVSAINSFPYAADPAAVVAEAARVLRPGGALVAAVWGPLSDGDVTAYAAALGCGSAASCTLSGDGVLENLLRGAGLSIGEPETVSCPWEYPDEATALRGLLSAGPAVRAIGRYGEETVRAAVLEAIMTHRREDGSYLLRNTVRFVVAKE